LNFATSTETVLRSVKLCWEIVLSLRERDLRLNSCKAENSDMSLGFLSGETFVEMLSLEVEMLNVE
jgi:hypothetical protein